MTEQIKENEIDPSHIADVVVIGAGHAGVEAALASARLGANTVLFTITLDALANMPCNPSIGGTGKGHLVYEIDALGGEMGRAADVVTLQSRTLNLGKGPAVHSKRIQADRMLYRSVMKQTVEDQPNLRLVQAEIVDILTEDVAEDGVAESSACIGAMPSTEAPESSAQVKKRVCGVVTKLGTIWSAKAVIIAAGTYLDSRVIVGLHAYQSGPDGMLPSLGLSDALKAKGIRMMRFKTGTPPRVHADSIDFSKLEVQEGEEHITPYSALTDENELNKIKQIPCHIVYTNETTHKLIRDNLDRSPLYNGMIEGTGPRYCPSIEDKVVRFADKERHQLFVEPMGSDTKEIYLQGFSSSLPEDVQTKMLHSLPGFEHAVTMRNAYAIEYDCTDPTQLRATLEYKELEGLYGAGQYNGTSGYEEAAAQGLIAGINAALKIAGKQEVTLTRDSSYIGTLIDDLITKGTNEPYRIMTSRSEYRLLLRQDNADERLTPIGYKAGLISKERYEKFVEKQKLIESEIERCNKTTIPPSSEVNKLLEEAGTVKITSGVKLSELIRRPQLTYEMLKDVDKERPQLPLNVITSVQIKIKYDGYIKRQLAEAEKASKMSAKKLPEDIDYKSILGLRLEARQKLEKIRPKDIGQASRISGVSPADISVLMIYLAQIEREKRQTDSTATKETE